MYWPWLWVAHAGKRHHEKQVLDALPHPCWATTNSPVATTWGKRIYNPLSGWMLMHIVCILWLSPTTKATREVSKYHFVSKPEDFFYIYIAAGGSTTVPIWCSWNNRKKNASKYHTFLWNLTGKKIWDTYIHSREIMYSFIFTLLDRQCVDVLT